MFPSALMLWSRKISRWIKSQTLPLMLLQVLCPPKVLMQVPKVTLFVRRKRRKARDERFVTMSWVCFISQCRSLLSLTIAFQQSRKSSNADQSVPMVPLAPYTVPSSDANKQIPSRKYSRSVTQFMHHPMIFRSLRMYHRVRLNQKIPTCPLLLMMYH